MQRNSMNLQQTVKTILNEQAYCSVHPTGYVALNKQGNWPEMCYTGHKELQRTGLFPKCKIVISKKEGGEK